MNKTKIILISIGGVTLLATLALAYFIYSAISAKSENSEELEYLESEASRLTRMSVYPGPEAVKATDDNRKAFADWSELAMGLASAGDQRFEDTTPASFKAFINDEAKRYAALPGSADGHFVKGDFGFGFDEYIHKGKLPAAADLPRLQREWNDIAVFLGILIDAKASSVSELQLVKEEVKEEEPRRGKRKRQQKKTDEEAKPDITRFNIVFTANPDALAKIFNDIAGNARFVVAEEYSFLRSPDELADKLGDKSSKKQEAGGRRRRRAETVQVEETTDDAKSIGVVTDPATVTDFKVSMKVAVYDFRTKAKPQPEKEEQE